MNVNFKLFLLAFISIVTVACNTKQKEKENFINEIVEFATAQTELMLTALGEPTGNNYPRRIREDGTVGTTGMYDWTPGFFPGSLWYLYELTGDDKWREEATKWTETLEPLKTFTSHHDLGFMMYCSYGNAIRLAPKPEYKDILIQSAGSLSTRFDERVGAIKSWNRFRPWGDTTVYHFPVIIDNMMNLEMLFYASRVTGNPQYYDISVKHSDATLKNQFREDFGTWHVVCYDPESPTVLGKFTSQGYSDNSTWARGQAWAIYGYTMTYRETGDKRYLDVATKAADFFLKHLPEDLIPVWDFNVGMEGFTPGERSNAVVFKEKLRDASAAAIVCSALFELGQLANNQSYIDTAIEMLRSLASPAYRAELGTNANFLLMHSVGALPQGYEIDTPLVYADYYFLEALVRYRNLNK
ncbi:MAG: glycoside hydrolase family 88 protein [Dysgonamonadaceae bacterium]|jgi:uncharacterized protein YyaL (SSP411 family)|nr:glycoside hydrolase family 88 protein [Dysgonamonadaceae bacterium]